MAKEIVAIAVGGVTLFGGIIIMMIIPAPVWFWVELPLYLVVAWLAEKIVMKQRSVHTA
ncbi:MAG: hypothetical protein H8E86_07280 [Planctomycetes bacterium]|nr:hypothetical protein [Planctomycetota bacterium]